MNTNWVLRQEWIVALLLMFRSLTTTTTTLPVPAPEPEITELKCYGFEQEVTVGETSIKWDSHCQTKHGGKKADEQGGECKLIDCVALSKNRLPTDSKDYPRSCFSHSINQFNGKYIRLHSCGPDRGEVIPYMLMQKSFDRRIGVDNGFLRKRLEEDCRVFEIKRDKVGLKRICMMEKPDCVIKYVDPGKKGEKLDALLLNGATVCPGHYVCRPNTVLEPETGATETFCVCEVGYKTCRLQIDAATNQRGCKQEILKKSEIGPKDSICDFASPLTGDLECRYIITTGCVCPDEKFLTNVGTGDYTLTAYCRYFPGFKNAILKKGMTDICRKKTRTTSGMWFPNGYEAHENSLCYCNQGNAACNGTPMRTISVNKLSIVIVFISTRIIKFD